MQELLSLPNRQKAEALWSLPDFPGFEDEGRKLVDYDDLRDWWKARKDRLRGARRQAATPSQVAPPPHDPGTPSYDGLPEGFEWPDLRRRRKEGD